MVDYLNMINIHTITIIVIMIMMIYNDNDRAAPHWRQWPTSPCTCPSSSSSYHDWSMDWKLKFTSKGGTSLEVMVDFTMAFPIVIIIIIMIDQWIDNGNQLLRGRLIGSNGRHHHGHTHRHHGYPAHSHHDKIPPWWDFVRDDDGGNLSVTKSHHWWW